MRKVLSYILEVSKIIIIALAIVIPVRYFLFQPFIVKGQSMEPNFSEGDYLIVDELSYRLRPPERGEIIIFKSPLDFSSRYIKRIIGLPGETIQVENGEVIVYINDNPQILEEGYLPEDLETSGSLRFTLGNHEYFVLGDNRSASYDSRKFGPLPGRNIIGRVYLRAWPFDLLDKIETPNY